MLQQFSRLCERVVSRRRLSYTRWESDRRNRRNPAAQEYVFLSSADYSREIEGDASKSPESKQRRMVFFEAVATLAQQRFGNPGQHKFSYRAPFNGFSVDWKDR